MLFNLSKSRRTQKDKRSQELAFVKMSTSLSEIDELLSKFVPNYAKIAEPHTTNAQEQEMTLR
jgi:ribosomal protein S18